VNGEAGRRPNPSMFKVNRPPQQAESVGFFRAHSRYRTILEMPVL
jgi:hypothetical protein